MTRLGDRVALVIGCRRYINLDEDHANAANDALAMGHILGRFGFDVTVATDPTREEWDTALRAFRRRRSAASLVLVFYAGSGFTRDGVTYLAPVDSDSTNAQTALATSVPLADVLRDLAPVAGPKIVVLDTCRNDPTLDDEMSTEMPPRRDIELAGGVKNTLIAYSTAFRGVASEGPPGWSSPYTTTLLRLLADPGRDVRDIFADAATWMNRLTDGRQSPCLDNYLEPGPVVINPGVPIALVA